MKNFKRIKGFPGYLISKDGKVFSHFHKDFKRLRIANHGYLVVDLYKDGKKRTFSVHQLVAITYLNHEPCGHDVVVDHIDGDKLNNRVENLQLITQRENLSKDKHRKNPSSKFTGVYWFAKSKKWRADIYNGSKRVYLGLFDSEEDAHKKYQEELSKLEK